MNKKKALVTLAIALFAINTHADTLTELQKCAKTKDSLIRLVCYDTAVKSLNSNVESKSLKTIEIDKTPLVVRATEPNSSKNKGTALRPVNAKSIVVKQTTSKEDAFGKEHIKKSKKEKAAELSHVTFTIKAISEDARKQKIITFENGQVWKKTNSDYIKLSVGNTVELSKGSLGVVFLKKTSQNQKVKVKRTK